MAFDRKKRAVAALQTSVKKLHQEVTSRKAAFYRVNNSVMNNVEDLLLKEFPEEYIIDSTRNWLKIQRDVSLVKKRVRNSSDLTWNNIRDILEANNKSFSLPPQDCANNTSEPAIQSVLGSYGVKMPKTKRCSSSTLASLQPNSEDEELEQLRMATKLSLTTNVTTTFTNDEPENKDGDTLSCNQNEDCGLDTNEPPSVVCQSQTVESGSQEAANILLGMSRGAPR